MNDKQNNLPISHSSFYLWVSNNQIKFLDQIKNQLQEEQRITNKNHLSTLIPYNSIKSFDIDYIEDGRVITKSGDIIDKIGFSGEKYIEFEYTNKHTDGFWDIKLDKKELSNKVLIEYKSSIEEMSIDDILIQIKKRCKTSKEGKFQDESLENSLISSYKRHNILKTESNWYENGDFTIVLASFDKRFEKFRRILWNEGIKLVLLDIDDFEEF